jgi:hypothetical protein
VRIEGVPNGNGEFQRAANKNGGLWIGAKMRIAKVIKTPVSNNLHPEILSGVLGIAFYKPAVRKKMLTNTLLSSRQK